MGDRRVLFGCIRRSLVFVAAILTAFLIIDYAPPAIALPSYARQTGQPCGTCHTDFAGLTPYGRLFKIQGYTAGGGAYRSTLFPTADDPGAAKPYAPPLAMMTVVGYSNTATPISPPSAPFNGNNNIALSSVNFMYGGAITEHIGTLANPLADLGVIHSDSPGRGTTPISAMRTR